MFYCFKRSVKKMNLQKETENELKDKREILEKIENPYGKLLYKITLARNIFKSVGAKKSGKNDYQNFKYFELEDILPVTDIIEEELLLNSRYVPHNNWGELIVSDVETMEQVKFPSHKQGKLVESGNINKKLQAIGKTTTYLKRYCYINYMNIVERDSVDKEDNREEPVTITPKKPVKPKAPKKSAGKVFNSMDELNRYFQARLKDTSDMEEAEKLLNKLKLEKRVSNSLFNEMTDVIVRNKK